ncbi:MAG: GLPGLI family protein [Aequorivita sp.]
MKIYISLLAIIFSMATEAQNIGGRAYYKSFQKVGEMEDSASKTPEQKKLRADLIKQIQDQLQKEYRLTFTDEESMYEEEAKLETPKPASSSGVTITLANNNEVLYRNLKDSTYVNETEILGKLFLIQDKLKTIAWTLEKETKNIGQYTCFKATYEREEKKEKYDYQEEEAYEVMETVVTTAWYTPQIPMSQGPDEYWGLPGLILEVNEGEVSLLCYKVILNPADGIDIKVPSKGKKIDQEKYDFISERKHAEMLERMKSDDKRKSKSSSKDLRIGG